MPQDPKKPETAQPSVAALPRPMDPFTAMRAEMDRVFDTFLGPSFAGSLGLGSGGRSLFARRPDGDIVVPSVDVREVDEAILVEAELPGLDEKDVSVTLRDGVLTIKGEKATSTNEKKSDYHLMERSYGSFMRAFRVPDAVDVEKVSATFDKGVLKVTLPKVAGSADREKRIPIGKT